MSLKVAPTADITCPHNGLLPETQSVDKSKRVAVPANVWDFLKSLWEEAATSPAVLPVSSDPVSIPDEDDVTITAEVTGSGPRPNDLTLQPTTRSTQDMVNDSGGHQRPEVPFHESQQQTSSSLQHFPVNRSEECPM